MVIEQGRTWLFRAGQLACLGFMGLLAFIDLNLMVLNSVGGLLLCAAHGLLILGTVVVWLPPHRAGSRLLPALVLCLGTASLSLTGFKIITGIESDVWGTWGLSEAAGVFLALFVAARRGRPPDTAVASAVALIALAAQPLRVAVANAGVLLGMIQTMLALVAIAVGVYLRYLADTRARQLAATRAEQRSEFARDLHDFIAHHVTGIVVQAQGARLIAERDPGRAAAALEQIERAGAETMSAMRRMVGVLRTRDADAPLAPLKSIADLEPLVSGFTAAGGPPVRVRVDGALDGLPVHVTTSAYRVVMEALTNVRQHAHGAAVVDVAIQRTRDWLLVTVTDDAPLAQRGGRGRDRIGFGLIGLAERVHAAGGRLHAGSGIERGWIVDVRLPIREVNGS